MDEPKIYITDGQRYLPAPSYGILVQCRICVDRSHFRKDIRLQRFDKSKCSPNYAVNLRG